MASAAPSGTANTTADAGLTFVALGDSWPEGAHCGGCRTFAGLYGDRLEELTGQPVRFMDFTGRSTGSSASLLDSLRGFPEMQAAVARADVVMIATGPNEMEGTGAAIANGSCRQSDGYPCIKELGDRWTRNFNASLDEVDRLRGGRPTAIRMVNAANPFISVPGMSTELGLPADFATTGGDALFAALTEANCDAAAAHGGQCVDVRPILNGPAMDEPTDENSPESHQAIADALIDLGLPELAR
jgi:hypothetical protein